MPKVYGLLFYKSMSSSFPGAKLNDKISNFIVHIKGVKYGH